MKEFGRILDWHDLSADEVYHIACLENEARDSANAMLGKLAIDPTVREDAALTILFNDDRRAASWLADQAAIRGLLTPEQHRSNRQVPNTPHISEWLAEQYSLCDTGLNKIAALAGVSPGYLSKLGNAHRSNPSPNVARQLAIAFAKARKLSEAETAALVIQVSNYAKVKLRP